MTDLFDGMFDSGKKPPAKPASKAPVQAPVAKPVIDLAEVSPDKREQVAANAEIAGFEVKNTHLLKEARKIQAPQNALLMEFKDNPPSEVQGMTPLFRMSRQRDLDILFCGLNIGPVFQDQVELAIKHKFLAGASEAEIADEHFVAFVYLAIALPFGEDDSMNTGWGLTFFCPKQFERILPKALRAHLGIDIWYKQVGDRFDVIWYYVKRVKNDEEKEAAINEAKRKSNLAYALTTMGAPTVEIPKQTIEKWVEEYYEKHPDEGLNTQDTSPQEETSSSPVEPAAEQPAEPEVRKGPPPVEIIYKPLSPEDQAEEDAERARNEAPPKSTSIF